MPIYKLIKNEKVENIIVAEESNIETIRNNYDSIEEIAPEVILEPMPNIYKVLTVPDFKMLFNQAERLAINSLKSTDIVVQDFYNILDDQRTINIDLNSNYVQEYLNYLVTLGTISEARKLELLAA